MIKWRWVQVEDKRWYDNLIGYSKTNKEHLEYFSQAIKYLDRPDCVRLIVEKVSLEK